MPRFRNATDFFNYVANQVMNADYPSADPEEQIVNEAVRAKIYSNLYAELHASHNWGCITDKQYHNAYNLLRESFVDPDRERYDMFGKLV